jgi:predicted RNA-binding Zn ribbon-like protein
MKTRQELPMEAPSSVFEFIGGEPSIDFVNTTDWVNEEAVASQLTSYDALVGWAELASVIDAEAAVSLRSRARRNPAEAARALEGVIELRKVLRRAFVAAGDAANKPGRGSTLEGSLSALNDRLHSALGHLSIANDEGKAALSWTGMAKELDCIEWPLVWGAVQLIASPGAKSIRVCPGSNCGWMYVDRSRNGLRRWCSMDTCGAREKARRHYARATGGSPGKRAST